MNHVVSRSIFPKADTTLVIAHRGRTPGGARDNTIAAFEQAVAAGANMVEFDVRLTKDEVMVIHHDATIGGKRLSSLNLAEIKQLPRGEDLCTLEELLAWAAGRVMVDVELKESGYEDRVLAAVRAKFAPGMFVVKSYEAQAVRRIHDLDPSVPVGLLMGHGGWQRQWRNLRDGLFLKWRLRQSGADFLAPHWKLANAGFARRAHNGGWSVLVWGNGLPAGEQAYLDNPQVFAVVTDDPALALQKLENPHR